MSIIAENRINKIYQYIESGPYTIEFNLEFGKGVDSTIIPDDSRMKYSTEDKFLIDEVVFDDGAKREAKDILKLINMKPWRMRNHYYQNGKE